MTTESTPTELSSAHWKALRFYSRRWRQRHGADMIAMMLDASDNGENPLSGKGRRSLMWSGLRQRFASNPYVWFWIALTLLSLAFYESASYRNLQIGLAADEHGTSGFHGPTFAATSIGALSFVTCLTILTVSLLHRPAFPRPASGLATSSLPGWIALALGAMVLVGAPLILGSLVFGVLRYRTVGRTEFRALATISAVVLGLQLLVLLPPLTLIFLG